MTNAAEEADKKDGQPGRIVASGRVDIGGPPSSESLESAFTSVFGETVQGKPADDWWSKEIGTVKGSPPKPPMSEREQMERETLRRRDAHASMQTQAVRMQSIPSGSVLHGVEPVKPDEAFDRYCRVAVVIAAEANVSNRQASKIAVQIIQSLDDIDIRQNPSYTEPA